MTMLGKHVSELDTPALCIDLDAMDANIASMASLITSRGKQWRPHVQCHNAPAIAQKQIAAGAIGATCATVAEACVMARDGVRDILIANMIVGRSKLERVARLCNIADPIVTIDHYAQAEALSAVCTEFGVWPRVIIEVDVGMQRVGIKPGIEATKLRKGIARLEGINPVGMMAYEGHLLRIVDPDEKRELINNAMTMMRHTRDMMLNDGYACDIVSAGGTGSYQITSECEVVTELQAGGGIFGDPFYASHCGVAGLKPALTVLATVVSRPALDRVVVDAGRKAIPADPVMPLVRDFPESKVTRLTAEHGELEVTGDARDLRIGDRTQLSVGHANLTTMLHSKFFGLRNEHVEAILPIAARDCQVS